MNKKLILVPVLLVASGAAWWVWHSGQRPGSGDGVTLYGNVDIREVRLAFGASDRVREVLVDEGDRVEPGQVLGRLDSRKLEAAVAAAEAGVEAQAQGLSVLEAGSRPEEISRARAQADALVARARTAQITYQRQQKLGRQKLASPEDLDQARAAADAAEAEAEAAEATHALAVEGPRSQEIAQAKAQLAARQAELDLARAQLADATLKSPATAIVRERILEPGDMATPQSPALTLALVDPLWVRAYVPEPELGRVVPGTPAEVRTDSFPGKVYQGWVGYVSPTAEFTPKSVETPELRTRLVYQVRILVCDPGDELRLGMPATVTIAGGAGPQTGTAAGRCASGSDAEDPGAGAGN